MKNVKCLPRPVQATFPAGDGTVVASQETHQPKNVLLKPFFPDLFLSDNCGALFELANAEELLRFFNDIFKLISTIYRWRTLKTARRLPNTNM